jgi:hypothetical protein
MLKQLVYRWYTEGIRLYRWLSAFGINVNVPKFLHAVKLFPVVIKEYFLLERQNKETGMKYRLKFSWPMLDEKHSPSGVASGHYFHQDLFVAKKIFHRKPVKHVDFGSRVDGFVAHVAVFRTIEVFDIRPLKANIPNITFRQCDLMDREMQLSDYCDSVSCLHALEHFGLGRYGDRVDINGHLLGLRNLHKILEGEGTLYLSVPIGPQRIDFNAHRVFAIRTVLEMIKGQFELVGFSYVDDIGDLHENVTLDSNNIAKNCGCYYGCGIFELKKIAGIS